MEVYKRNTYTRVFAYARGSEILFVFGILSSAIVGAVYPVFSIFLSMMLKVMMMKQNDFIDQANKYALIFFLLGLLGLIMSVIQNAIFSVIGE
jgi:hypothetical protein